MTRARIRNLWGEYSDAELVEPVHPKVVCVKVPGFGALVVANGPGDVPRAVLAQGPGRGELPRDVVVFDDGHLEIELLPNSSGEDRIVVVIDP